MAIQLPDGKLCLNLPEQVAKNAKDILTLADAWSYYQPLFAEYSEEWENEIKPAFDNIPATILTTLSTADVVTKTLTQTEPNVDLDLDSNILIEAPTGLTPAVSYYRGEVINGIFYFVLQFSLTNSTASSVNVGNALSIYIKEIPQTLSDLIYCYDGTTLTEVSISNKSISAVECYDDAGSPNIGYYSRNACPISKARDALRGARTIVLNPRNMSAVGAGATVNYIVRFTFTIL